MVKPHKQFVIRKQKMKNNVIPIKWFVSENSICSNAIGSYRLSAIFYFSWKIVRFRREITRLCMCWISLAVCHFFRLFSKVSCIHYIFYKLTQFNPLNTFVRIHNGSIFMCIGREHTHTHNTYTTRIRETNIISEMKKKNEMYQRFIAHHFKYRSSFRVYWLSQ